MVGVIDMRIPPFSHNIRINLLIFYKKSNLTHVYTTMLCEKIQYKILEKLRKAVK
nr:MAG TPA: hypothetical protein [Caudoviricetes sp.]